MDGDLYDLHISVTETDGHALIGAAGVLDVATAPRLRAELASLLEHGVHDVIIDMARLEFIDSTGLAALIFGLRRLRDAGGTLTLQSPNPKAMKTLTITGLTQVFTIT